MLLLASLCQKVKMLKFLLCSLDDRAAKSVSLTPLVSYRDGLNQHPLVLDIIIEPLDVHELVQTSP